MQFTKKYNLIVVLQYLYQSHRYDFAIRVSFRELFVFYINYEGI